MLAHGSEYLTSDVQSCKFMIMTSPLTHDDTRHHFEINQYFGGKKENVIFFKQPMLPIVNFDGKIIMNEPNHMIVAPNGSGGLYEALNNCQNARDVINTVDYV